MEQVKTRNDVARVALETYRSSGKTDATFLIGTGVGKSKIAIDIVRHFAHLIKTGWRMHTRLLILVPQENLQLGTWPEEIKKFGIPDYVTVEIECYQTAYKWKNRQWEVVIADEFDFSLTPAYSEFYEHNTWTRLFGFTASMPEEKREMCNNIAPIVFEYSTQDAQRDGILNKTKFYQVNYDLGHTHNVLIATKTKRFYQSENRSYEYLDDEFRKQIILMNQLEGKAATADLLEENAELEKFQKELSKAHAKMKMFSRKRGELLHTLKSSEMVTKVLVNAIHQEEGHKVLIFSKLTEQADRVSQHTYHGKNKEKDNLAKFARGEIKTLGVCAAVNRGQNIPGVDHIIKESYIGSEVEFQQQHGRGTRLEAEEVMSLFILVPHYWKRVLIEEKGQSPRYEWQRKPTQANHWAANMAADFGYGEMEVIEMVHNRMNDTYTLPTKYAGLCKSS